MFIKGQTRLECLQFRPRKLSTIPTVNFTITKCCMTAKVQSPDFCSLPPLHSNTRMTTHWFMVIPHLSMATTFVKFKIIDQRIYEVILANRNKRRDGGHCSIWKIGYIPLHTLSTKGFFPSLRNITPKSTCNFS